MPSFHGSPDIMHVYVQVAFTTQVHKILNGCRWFMTTVFISIYEHGINPVCRVLLRKIDMHFLIFCGTEMVYVIEILPYGWQGTVYYASTFRCCRHYISGCLSACLSEIWKSIFLHICRPNAVFVSVCLSAYMSVCPERFPGMSKRMHVSNSLKFGSVIYPDHFQKWLDFGHSILMFLLLMRL